MQMLQTATTLSDLRGRYAGPQERLISSLASGTQVGDSLHSFGSKMQGIGTKMQSVGSTLTKGLTVPLLAGAGVAVKAAVDYETAFAGVKKQLTAHHNNSRDYLTASAKWLERCHPVRLRSQMQQKLQDN